VLICYKKDVAFVNSSDLSSRLICYKKDVSFLWILSLRRSELPSIMR
jgi:hypothetical protein